MSDIHKLPLLGHDLPSGWLIGLTEAEAAALPRIKARVYKSGPWWTWDHACRWKSVPTDGYPHKAMESAFSFALDHARKCM